ncbi:methionine--tRNA ligase [soil metagenome]
MPTPVYITTPIYYVNDRPHIGHCYTTTLADILARFHRLLGHDTFFLTGTDEHADKVIAKAVENNLTPQAWADLCAAEFQKAFALIDISEDIFYRTSDPHHKALAQQYIRKLQSHADIYLGDYIGWYDTSQDEYLTETLAKESNFKSPVTGKPLEKRTEKNYFFRLSKYQDALQQHIDSIPGFILPDVRRNEVLGRLRQGLQDVPVSRAVKPGESDWGVFMPDDPTHRVYVWIEALCNYLTAVDTPARRKYWPAAAHLMAKEILWFHAVIWPAMLMAIGEPLPKMIYAHSYWVRDGKKMSKSLGNFVDLDVITAYVARFGSDAFRYYLAAAGPLYNSDSDFSHAKFVEVYNADLANGLGNAASRVGNMVDKYFAGVLPDLTASHSSSGAGAPLASALHPDFNFPALTAAALDRATAAIARADVAAALSAGLALVRSVDGYINATEPFKLAKRLDTEPGAREKLGFILTHCAETLRVASILMSPAIPRAAARLWQTWNCTPPPGVALHELCAPNGPHALRAGQHITKGEVLFMRIDPAEPAPASATKPDAETH